MMCKRHWSLRALPWVAALGIWASGCGEEPVGGGHFGSQNVTSSEVEVPRRAAFQEATAADGGTSKVRPSPGCRIEAGHAASGTLTQRDRIYAFPSTYDGRTPAPMLLALHAAGNPNTQLQNLTNGTRLQDEFVRVFPKSKGTAWSYESDLPLVRQVIEDVLSAHCIDMSRIFATGHSSGAQMLVQMLCRGESRFAGVAPVAASKYCDKTPPVPVMYIQGMHDAQRGGGNGLDVVKVFSASNGCMSATMPQPDVAGCRSTFDRLPVAPGCVSYQGCRVPTVWCSHNDNGYNKTDGQQHGWPCFASTAMAQFFLSIH